MAEDATYQTKVYREQGGGAEVVQSGGIIRGHSGGIMSMESGFNFNLASQAILAKDIARVVHSWNNPTVITPALADSKLTGQDNLPDNVRIVTILGSVTMSKASFWLTSVSAGREVLLRVVGDLTGTFTNNNTSIRVTTSGCTLLNSLGGAITNLHMQTSAASDTAVHLFAVADNVWAIVGELGTNTES